MNRRAARAVLLLSATALPLLAGRPAAAHAILVASTPAIGATVPAGTLAIKLRYNSRLDLRRSRVTIAGPDDTASAKATRLPVTGTSEHDEFDANVPVRPGTYVIRWQALALDGHITRGEVPFTVAPASH